MSERTVPEATWNRLHALWTKAVGTEGYAKKDWQDLERAIIALCAPAQPSANKPVEERSRDYVAGWNACALEHGYRRDTPKTPSESIATKLAIITPRAASLSGVDEVLSGFSIHELETFVIEQHHQAQSRGEDAFGMAYAAFALELANRKRLVALEKQLATLCEQKDSE